MTSFDNLEVIIMSVIPVSLSRKDVYSLTLGVEVYVLCIVEKVEVCKVVGAYPFLLWNYCIDHPSNKVVKGNSFLF